MRHPAPRRAPFPSILLLVLLAGSALAASPPFPGKKGPQAPRYGRAHAPELEPPPPFQTGFRSPTLGAQTYNVLAVRLAFSDTPIDSSTAYYDRLLFFLNQYWNQASDGQVTLSTTLADSVFTLPQTMAYYGDDDHFQERLVYMVRDMVALADSTIDFRPYQAIVIFHAGAGQEADVFDDSRQQVLHCCNLVRGVIPAPPPAADYFAAPGRHAPSSSAAQAVDPTAITLGDGGRL